MSEEAILPVSVRAQAAPNGGVAIAIHLSCTPPLLLELPADTARTVMREMAAAIGDGFERTHGTEVGDA